MKIEFAKWGNSLAVRIPAALAKQVGAREGKSAEIVAENGVLVLRPLARPIKHRRYTLQDLLEGMTRDHLHPPADWGPRRGKEVW